MRVLEHQFPSEVVELPSLSYSNLTQYGPGHIQTVADPAQVTMVLEISRGASQPQ